MKDELNVQQFDDGYTTTGTSNNQDLDVDVREDINETQDVRLNLDENVARDIDDHLLDKSVSDDKKTSEPFISVQYNHEIRDFTKEEAIKHIQKGMHTEHLRAKLEFLAKRQGKSVNAFVDDILIAAENNYRKYLEKIYGDDVLSVEAGMKIYREKQSDEYKRLLSDIETSKMKQEKFENINSMLAEQYITLKKEIPDAPEYTELPTSVIVEAAKGNCDLCSAYLRYLYKEKQKIEAAQKFQSAAKNASSGKMNEGIDGANSSYQNFLSGLWSK